MTRDLLEALAVARAMCQHAEETARDDWTLPSRARRQVVSALASAQTALDIAEDFTRHGQEVKP